MLSDLAQNLLVKLGGVICAPGRGKSRLDKGRLSAGTTRDGMSLRE